MRHICEYELKIAFGLQAIYMHGGAAVLGVRAAAWEGSLLLHAIADTKNQFERRGFRVLGSGYAIEDVSPETYVGTALSSCGSAWHVFDCHEETSQGAEP
jgi:hypothetical protein